MPRAARLMIEGVPFHLTHRGNQRRTVFQSDQHRAEYVRLLGWFARRFGMAIWAYCLMPNHVHLLAVGRNRAAIPKTVGHTHRTYSGDRNRETGVTGHLWANRYFSTPLDELHLWAAVRYVELNPVKAGIVERATDYSWSSARAHAGLTKDPLVDPSRPFPGPIADWSAWLGIGIDDETIARIRRNTRSGRPTGGEDFVRRLEQGVPKAAERKTSPLLRNRGGEGTIPWGTGEVVRWGFVVPTRRS